MFGYHIILRLPVQAEAAVMTPAGGGQTVFAMAARAPQAAVDAFVESEGILRAKHILIDTRELMAEEQVEANAFAIALFEELQALSGDELLERFDEMMADYGEDPGMLTNPDGYTFGPGAMVREFTEGTEALGLYEVGPPVQSTFGYHIILRLPVQADDFVMMPGGAQPLSSMIAWAQADFALERVKDGISYELMPIFSQIVPGEVFAQQDEDEDEEEEDEE